MTNNILLLKDIKKYFSARRRFARKTAGVIKAVDGASFSIREGEIFGLVGESGCGKSTLGYIIAGIYEPTSGELLFKGEEINRTNKKKERALKKDLQIAFQDPGSSLNPRRKIRQTLQPPLRVHKIVEKEYEARKIASLLEMVGLPHDYMHKYPAALSGGQKQRVAIARALATEPSFIVLDEPTSALDVSVQGKIITLLLDIKERLGLSMLFITHDLSLIRNVASRIGIMYLGKVCELGKTSDLFENPLHPYTRMLLSSIPVISREEEAIKPKKTISIGEVPSPVNPPAGCAFHPRCLSRMDICSRVKPPSVEAEQEHIVSCHLFNGKSGGAV